jgi:hypothetical protein
MRPSLGFLGLPVVMIFLAVVGCASNRPTNVHHSQVDHEALVTVEAIDVPNRLVTVRDASGQSFTVYVDKSNKAFPQAAAGDQVRVRYTESFALLLVKKGESGHGLQITEETSRPQPGKPAGEATTEVKATVKIESVDRDGSAVTFTGPRGRRSVQILDPSLRDYVMKLRAGDSVDVTYKEAVAISLERIPRG